MLSAQNILFFGAIAPESITSTATTPKADGEKAATGDFMGLLAVAESELRTTDTPVDRIGEHNAMADDISGETILATLPEPEAMPQSETEPSVVVPDVPVEVVSEKTIMPIPSTLPDESAVAVTDKNNSVATNVDETVITKTSNDNRIFTNTDVPQQAENSLVMEKTPIARNLEALRPFTDSGQEAIRAGIIADKMSMMTAESVGITVTVDQPRATVDMPILNQSGSSVMENVSGQNPDTITSRFDAFDSASHGGHTSQTLEDDKNLTARTVEQAIAFESDARTVSGRNGVDPLLNQLASALHVKQVRTENNRVLHENHTSTMQSQPSVIKTDTNQSALSMVDADVEQSATPTARNGLSTAVPSAEYDHTAPKPETGDSVMQNTKVISTFEETMEKANGRSFETVTDATSFRSPDIANDRLSTWNTLPVDKAEPIPVKSETTPVRFVLPTDIDTGTVRTGQSVTIRMEPEHLGQVRLTLSEHHDSIVGRLVVENHAARTVVESNLQTLYDQLTDKGIDLDAFQVFVGGDGSASLARRQQGQNTRRTNGGNTMSTSAPVGDATVSSRSGGGLYINATGVNWVA